MRYLLNRRARHLLLPALLSLSALSGCGGGGTVTLPATRYVLTDLTPNGNFARPFTINNSGQVGGYYSPNGTNHSQPFLWTPQ